MALTHKEARQLTETLWEKFNTYAKPTGQLTDLTGIAIGISDNKPAQKHVTDFQQDNNQEKIFLKRAFSVHCITTDKLTQDQKDELKTECSNFLGRAVDDSDIKFLGNMGLTLH